ncbi:MAG: diaminopimelate decarboxylase, partial [Bellilinea sp.]
MDTSTDFSLFPITTTINSKGHLSIAGHDLADLAATYGTPLYIYDGATIRAQLDRLKTLFKHYYSGEAMVAYASKAYFSRSFAARLAALGTGSDVVGLGEIHVA